MSHFGNIRIPTVEGVGILCIGCFIGRALEGRGCTVFILFGCGFSVYDPGNGILVLGCGIGCGVGCFTCYGNRSDVPTCKGVGIFGSVCLGGICMSGNLAVLNRCGVDYAAVIVLPCDGIRIDGGIELCGVGYIARYGSNCRRPTIIKGISILCGCGLGRGCAFVSRCCTVSNLFFFESLAVAVYPSDGVFVDGGFISCSVGCNTVYSLDFRSPTCKGVGVLCGCRLGRGCTVVSGYCAVFHFRELQDRSVFVHKFDCVLVDSGSELCSVSDIAGYGRKSLVPTGEGVGVLCIGCLIGRALEARCYTVFILFCCCVAVYDPGDGVLSLFPC